MKGHRSAYAKFRTGVSPLRVKTGRYEQIELERRVYFNCDTQVESEEHVLTQFPVYDDLRTPLYDRMSKYIHNFESKGDTDKLFCILGSDVIPVMRASAKIYDILIRQLLYP